MPTPKINHSERYSGLDALRILACFGVVAIHCYTHKVSAFGQISMPGWWEANFAFALSRWVLPAFVMISGYLLLGKEVDMKKRLLRVGTPLVFWSVIYFLVRRYDDGPAMTWKQVGYDLFYGQPYYHLYFLFLIFGLYLLTPLFNRFIRWASPRQAFYTMFVLLGATIVYKWTEQFYPEYVFKTNAFTYCLRFAPVYLLGYYLRFVPLTRRRALLGILALIAIVPLLALLNYFSFVDWDRGTYFMAYLSPFVLLFAAIMVTLFSQAQWQERKWIRHLSDCTMGIYLFHPLIVEHWKGAPPFVELVGAFVGSYIVVTLLRRIRLLRYAIG